MFHGSSGMDRFGRVHADEPDGAILALIPDYESIAVNHTLHTRLRGSGPLLLQPRCCIGHGFTSPNVVGVACEDGKATGR